jgi:hypothetical protein
MGACRRQRSPAPPAATLPFSWLFGATTCGNAQQHAFRYSRVPTTLRQRENASTAHTALVAVTGYGSQEDRSRSTDAGIDHHLVKPVDITVIKRLIERIAPGRRSSGRST